MTTNFDGLQLPEGEVKVADQGVWRSVMFTDDLRLENILWLEKQYPYADMFKFSYRGKTYYWNRTGVRVEDAKKK